MPVVEISTLLTIIYTIIGVFIGGGTIVIVKVYFPKYDIFKIDYKPAYYGKGKHRNMMENPGKLTGSALNELFI